MPFPAWPLSRMARVATLGLLSLLPAAGAHADCSVPGYAEAADPRLAGMPPCEEAGRFSIQTPRGPRQVRMIRDRLLPGDWREPEAMTRRAIVRSAETLMAIGSGTVPDLLVLITGLQPSEEAPDPRDPEAVEADRRSFQEGVADGRSGAECLLVVYPSNTAPEDFGFVVAHEFFHCVQFALARSRMNGRAAGLPDSWWVEGGAEWFANRAYSESHASDLHVPRFDKRTPDRPIVETSYDGFVLWSWYAGQWGDGAVIDYLRLAPGGGKARQLSGAASLMTGEKWLEFTQDYLDRRVRYPDARRIPVRPEPGETYLWSETDERSLKGERQALYRANLIFTCGRWRIESSDEEGEWKVRKPDEPGAWIELPEELEIAPGEERRYLLGAVGVGDSGFRLTVTATRDEESAAACNCGRFAEDHGTRRDACLVGSWHLVSGGLNEWLDRAVGQAQRASGAWASYDSDTEAADEGRRLVIAEDGRYHYGESSLGWSQEATTEKGDRYASRIRAVAGGAGYWSTRDGLLNVCALSEASGAVAELQLKDEHMTVELPGYLSEHLYSGGYHYACAGDSLSLRHTEVSGTPFPMEWRYERID